MTEEFDLIVIGAGPGGYVAAIRAAQLGLKTACVEKEKVLGGTCLNIGCIPSKCLLQSSEMYVNILHHAKTHGIEASPTVNFSQMMKRKREVISGFNMGISALFKKNKVSSITGTATFKDPHTLTVDGTDYLAKNFILATGSEPTPLPFLPFDEETVLSSTGALALKEIPKKMIVVGAGIIGVELGSVYSRLGTEVHFVEFLDKICPTLDDAVSKALQKTLTKQGLTFQLSSKVAGAEVTKSGVTLSIEGGESLSADKILLSIGRRPYTQNLGLKAVQITPDQREFIPIDSNFRTTHPHIYAIGDLVGGPMLAHKASEEGYAVAELLAGKTPHIDYIAMPSVVYTHPEVSAVGLTEQEAKARNIPIATGQFPFKANSRARCSGGDDDFGFVKLIAHAQTQTLLGAHIISVHAGELIAEVTLALQTGVTALDLAHTCHAHPTFSEALKEGALALVDRPIHS
ncbi:MAG: dihydrolipoyl dehydrogenase [Candidatus Neptunochlamydia sp.]|nr:dihydrolipoyl dehydrogenase [Candidatus Neptunochlamydia sp.]